MPRIEYKGETPSKNVARILVWQQHLRLLKPATFKATPHVFLASRVAGDVATLQDMGVPPKHIWAVEKDRGQYQQLLQRRKEEGFCLFPEKVEAVMRKHTASNIRSVYLDYCGNLDGTASTTRRVVARLPSHSALSVTLFLGREHEQPEDREVALLRSIRDQSPHQVTVVQSILYTSSYFDTTKSSPMGTWTFYIGPMNSRARMRFNLNVYSSDEVKQLSATPDAVTDLWLATLKRTKTRSKAAAKANVTRAA